MSRLIDADALIEDINVWFADSYHLIDSVKERIDAAPTIEQPHWIPCSERLPGITEPVNITWVNRKPAYNLKALLTMGDFRDAYLYYAGIKDKTYTDTAIYCNGKWWWYSVTCKDYLDEYGKSPGDDMDEDIEVIAWMPLPKPARLEGE